MSSQYNDDYQKQLYAYAQNQVNEKLIKQGKRRLIKDIPKVYVMYVRKSTKGKKRQERSIPDQIADCQKKDRSLKIKPIHIFREEESAKVSGKRDEFKEMLKWIESGRCNAILSWHPNRLARNMMDAGKIIDLLDKGILVDLAFSQYTFINDTNGIMTLGIQFVMAKQYSDNLSESSKRGSVNIAKEGKSTREVPKHGYRIHNRYFRPDGRNYDLLKQAFQMGLDGIPQEKIADFLNKEGFEYRGKKNEMRKQKISKIFSNPFYAGIYVFGSEIIEMRKADRLFQPMLKPLEFLQLRKILNDNYNYQRVPGKLKTILFNNMVYCGYCKRLMSPGKTRGGNKKSRYLSLRCGKSGCLTALDSKIKAGLRGKVIMDYIINILKSGFEIDKKAYDDYVRQAKIALSENKEKLVNRLRSTSRQITDIEKEIDTRTKALAKAKGRLIDKLNDEIEKLSKDKEKLEAYREKVNGDIININNNINSKLLSYENFLNFFENLANTIKNSDNRYLVDKIIRMIFLNFTVKDKKVLSHQLNPNFEKYLKVPSVPPSRADWT